SVIGCASRFPGFLTSCLSVSPLGTVVASCRVPGRQETHLPPPIFEHPRPPSSRQAPPRYGRGMQEVRKPGKVPPITVQRTALRGAVLSRRPRHCKAGGLAGAFFGAVQTALTSRVVYR